MRLAEPEQRRRRDGRIVEADDAIEVQAGVGEIARCEQLAATLEHRQRRVTGQSTARARVERSGRRRGVVHRPDDTRLAGMCGRFTQQRPASELAEIFGAEPLMDDPGERYNVAPTDEAAVVVQREDRRAVTAYRWGLIPHWAKEAKVGSRMFNARAETITTSPAFRDAFVRKRCLVPVDSFYEWKQQDAATSTAPIASPTCLRLRMSPLRMFAARCFCRTNQTPFSVGSSPSRQSPLSM